MLGPCTPSCRPSSASARQLRARDAALLELLDSFLDQDADWLAADAYIRTSASEASREQPEMVDELAQAAPR